MTSVLSVCNRALASMGSRTTISSFEEDSPAARGCSLFFDAALRTTLRAAHWGFARRVINAAQTKAAYGYPGSAATAPGVWSSKVPPPPWLFQYAYPNDCLAIRYVLPQVASAPDFPLMSIDQGGVITASPVRWQKILDVEGENQKTAFVTNAEKALLCYTAKVTDISVWDDLAENALVFGLASQLAIPLSGDKNAAQALAERANANLIAARIADGNEGVTIIDNVPDWLAVRGVSGIDVSHNMAEFGPLFEVL